MTSVDDIVHAARLYADTRNYARARQLLGQALAENPNDPAVLAQYARVEHLLGHHEVAANSAYSALSQEPTHEHAMRIYSLALEGLRRHHEALWMAWRTVTTHPQEPLAHYLYASLLRQGHRPLDALVVVTEALRLNSQDADFHVLRGLILKDLGRVAESSQAYHEALRLEPGHANAMNNLAVNRLKRGKLSKALSGFMGAAQADPALGDLARNNVAVVIARVTRFTTPVIAFEGIIVMLAGSPTAPAGQTLPARVLAGICVALLVAVWCWLVRALPRRVLVTALRTWPILAIRTAFTAFAVLVGLFGVLGRPWVLLAGGGLALLFGGVIIRFTRWDAS